MNPIDLALQAGHSIEKILQFISKTDPALASKINLAISAGYPAEKILGFIRKNSKGLTDSFPEDHTTRGLHEQARKSVHPALEQAGKVAGTAAMVALPFAAMRGLSMARSASIMPPPPPEVPLKLGYDQKLLPFNQQKQIPQMPPPSPSPMQQTPGQQMQQSVQTPSAPEQAAQAAQAIPQVDSQSIIQQMGLEDSIRTLQSAGNTPETIASAIEFSMRPEQKKWLQSQTKAPFSEIVKDYISKVSPTLQAQEIQQQVPEVIQPQKEVIAQQNEPIELEKETIQPEKITQGSTVITPDGIGTIEKIPGETAKVKIDGKSTIHKTDELIDLPMPEKDLADLYDDVIKGINKETGQEVSRMVQWAGYDPETNELAFIPHDGGLYIYDDISEEDRKVLTDFLTQRKTSGQNYIGAWLQGTKSPIGAAMSALIQRLQKERGGKGKEYKGKYPKIYDALEPAKLASKEKFKAKQKEESEKRRKEKQAKKSNPY